MLILTKPVLQGKLSNTQIQFLRYLLVGGIAFVADFGGLYLIKEHGNVNYLVAATLAFIIGLLINYLLSIYWVFDERTINNKYLEFIIFSIIGVFGVLLNLGIIFVLTECLNFFYLHSKLMATLCVFLFNFSARKIYLFSKN